MDYRTPTEAAFMSPTESSLTDVTDYREQGTRALLTARSTAVKNIQKAQKRYKLQYNCKAMSLNLQSVNWVLVCFPAEESGKNRKLSRPWHGPYCAIAVNNPDVTVTKVYFPQDKQITIHQSWVKYCPAAFSPGFYRYGGKQKGLGNVPEWVQNLLSDATSSLDTSTSMELDDEPPPGDAVVKEADQL